MLLQQDLVAFESQTNARQGHDKAMNKSHHPNQYRPDAGTIFDRLILAL